MLKAVYEAQDLVGSVPQVELKTEHTFHAGMYARTVRLPAGVVGVGTLVKIPTLLVVHGDVDVLVGEEWVEIHGYGVLSGSAGRKPVFITRGPVEMTMLFPTQAQTVVEAEREFTDEHEQLLSRRGASINLMTEE